MPKRRVKRHLVTQPSDQSYRFIPLTQGQNAIIDTQDFERASKYNWHAWKSKSTNSFYAMGRPAGRRSMMMHNFILELKCGERADHVNHNTLDNRKMNLRLCSHAQNQHNLSKRKDNSSGYIGVSWCKSKSKWRGYISLDYRQIFVGYFNDSLDAAKARDLKAIEIHGTFASLNFPNVNTGGPIGH